VQNKKKVNEMVEDVFGRCPTDELLVELDRIGVPARRFRSIREVYDWEQTRSQAPLIDLNHSTLGPITLPGPRCASSTPTAPKSRAPTISRRASSAPTTTPCPIGCHREWSGDTPRRAWFIGLLAGGGTWESCDRPAGDAGASTDYADALRETIPGTTSDEIQHTTATDLVINIDCTASRIKDNQCLIPPVL
jgi:CoA-transferase family III